MKQPMLCARCRTMREYPKDFPHPVYAICVDCYEQWSAPASVQMWGRLVARLKDWWNA